MFLVVIQNCRFVLALVIIGFFIIKIKLFNLIFPFFSLAKIDGFSLSPKYLSIVAYTRALIKLYANKIDYK